LATAGLAAAVLALPTGCVNISAMVSKMILGDPQIAASFRQRTGVTLSDKHTVIVYCTAPTTVLDDHASVALDLQKQLSQQMGRRGIHVVSPNEVSRAVDDNGGRADHAFLARKFPEADYIFTISLGAFDCEEPNSPNLFRGFASGMIRGYEAKGEEAGSRHAIQIFEQEFQVEHPTHPVPRDSISPSTFEKQFLDRLSNELGHFFYDFRTSEII
jgi:hypothetical protein